jgi:hypothetical protein
MPVLFLYIMPSAAARVRAALNMESKLGPYYDPSSQGNIQYFIFVVSIPLCYIKFRNYTLSNTTL